LTILGQYFTSDEIINFRKLQATTGAIISGSTAVQFFDRDVYTNSDLDVYVEHQTARSLARWLEQIGYVFVSRQETEVQTLEMALDTNSDFRPVDPMTELTDDAEKGYFDAVVILDFQKVNHPDIQLITSRGPPLELVLNFHSSKHSHYCFQ